jgi:hypothetical protein
LFFTNPVSQTCFCALIYKFGSRGENKTKYRETSFGTMLSRTFNELWSEFEQFGPEISAKVHFTN